MAMYFEEELASWVFLVPAWRRTLVSLSASSTDPDHPPTSAKGEGHPSEMSALEYEKKNLVPF